MWLILRQHKTVVLCGIYNQYTAKHTFTIQAKVRLTTMSAARVQAIAPNGSSYWEMNTKYMQDTHGTYHATLRRVRETVVTVENKYYIFWVSICEP
jgi:hypothetical protein